MYLFDHQRLAFLERLPLLRAVDRSSTAQRRLWRACELCSYWENRLNRCPSPRDYARHRGFRVRTPNIPGLSYPSVQGLGTC
jgi:hypothetical protein